MIRHVVMWKVKQGSAGELKQRLEALPPLISEIRRLEVGLNIVPGETARDLVLISDFDDLAALDRYVKHPAHQLVVDFVKQVSEERRAVDFEIGA